MVTALGTKPVRRGNREGKEKHVCKQGKILPKHGEDSVSRSPQGVPPHPFPVNPLCPRVFRAEAGRNASHSSATLPSQNGSRRCRCPRD